MKKVILRSRHLPGRMSHFSIACTDVLDRMKAHSGTTRQAFAARIGMPLSTLTSYANGRTPPDAEALTHIATGVSPEDAFALLRAALADFLPADWQRRIQFLDAPMPPVPGIDWQTSPAGFRRDITLLIAEAQKNEHVIAFIAEFVTVLGLRRKPRETPDGRTTRTTRAYSLNEPPPTPVQYGKPKRKKP